MNSILPSISVIIPTYNRKLFLERTIQSVLNQTVAPVEIIVVDDGSTDGTEQFIKEHFEGEVRYLCQPNRERGAARNFGASVAQGDYIYFLDSDDILYPDHIAAAQEFIQANNKPEWFFQEYEFQLSNGPPKSIVYNRKRPIEDLVKRGNFMSCHGVFLRRDIALLHPFNEDRKIAGSEDYLLWLQLAARYPLYINKRITSALIEHEGRSVFNFNSGALIARKEGMLSEILKDLIFHEKYKKWIPALKANTYSYLALHLAMVKSKKAAFRYFLKALTNSHSIIFSRRFAAILKKLAN